MFRTKIFKGIQLSVSKLDEELRDNCADLGIFVQDVNIMPEVLEVLWNTNGINVHDIMTQLEQKSFIVMFYNRNHIKYVYGIQKLLLAYLQKEYLSSEDIRKRHKKLILAYKQKSNGDFAQLPNDNYIFQYIGYHLYEAKMHNEFTPLYFDLNFISAKIKATGIADLLGDYKIYEKEITSNVSYILNGILN